MPCTPQETATSRGTSSGTVTTLLAGTAVYSAYVWNTDEYATRSPILTPWAVASGEMAAMKPPPSWPPMKGSSRLYRPERW